jgi:hypothetical protein
MDDWFGANRQMGLKLELRLRHFRFCSSQKAGNSVASSSRQSHPQWSRKLSTWIGNAFGLALSLSALCLVWAASGNVARAQTIGMTTVQGTVYLANGQVGSGTLVLSWPAFTTASGQAVAADSTTVTIPSNGLVSVNLAPNQGATPAGLYYTAVYYLSDGATTTQYRRIDAAQLLAVLNGVVHQPSGGVVRRNLTGKQMEFSECG